MKLQKNIEHTVEYLYIHSNEFDITGVRIFMQIYIFIEK